MQGADSTSGGSRNVPGAERTNESTASGDRSAKTSNGRAPPDVGDGSDDDIVARQLREAAEKEPDPELREKLWDEYRRYKYGTDGKTDSKTDSKGEAESQKEE